MCIKPAALSWVCDNSITMRVYKITNFLPITALLCSLLFRSVKCCTRQKGKQGAGYPWRVSSWAAIHLMYSFKKQHQYGCRFLLPAPPPFREKISTCTLWTSDSYSRGNTHTPILINYFTSVLPKIYSPKTVMNILRVPEYERYFLLFWELSHTTLGGEQKINLKFC